MNPEKIAFAMIKLLKDEGHYVDDQYGPEEVCVDAWISFVKLANVAIETIKGRSDEADRMAEEEKKGDPS